MSIKYLKVAIFAATSLSISALSYAHSDQAENKREEADQRMQQMIDERCGTDEKCQQRMKEKFGEKRDEKAADREGRRDREDKADRPERGERPEHAYKGKDKGKNGRDVKRQEMLEKRCGDDQQCLEKMNSRMADKMDEKAAERGERGERKAQKMDEKLNDRCGDDEKCREKMTQHHDKKMQEKEAQQQD